MKSNKLKAIIVEKFQSQREFAETIGMTEAKLSRHLNGKTEWRASEMIKAVKALNIPLDEAESYFFNSRVTKIKRKRV